MSNLLCPILSLCLVFLWGCTPESPSTSSVVHEISGRDEERNSLYRIKAPEDWRCVKPSSNESLLDTTKCISEFFIQENQEVIRITIHNFPTENMESRISPLAQIARWKRQFVELDAAATFISPQSFSGFVGFLFESTGEMNNEQQSMMGWAMQLDPNHYRTLSHPAYPIQMRADVTIKAVGPKELMEKYRASIFAFARTFELIDEITN